MSSTEAPNVPTIEWLRGPGSARETSHITEDGVACRSPAGLPPEIVYSVTQEHHDPHVLTQCS